ncbi:MAG TPA: hypothetical protein VNY76_06120 [Candidatus Acidoferrales bacterium]|nr:hypothetical protein [Candidatus Acidoferrales bacterium]
MGDARRGGAQRNAALWVLAFGAIGVALLARNLLGLDRTPPGMYVDEASIGYNAWAIAHYGVDEHGFHLPLYFQAFGEYKNPLYIYTLVPFLRVLPVTATVERLPAVVFGVIAVLFISLAAWRISRSRGVTLFVAALAALTPWLTQESRVGFEVIALVATMAVAVWCLADDSRVSPARFALAGVFLAISIFAYSAGRLEILLFAVAFALVYRHRRQWWLALVPVVAGYAVLGVWSLQHPGALTAEFSVVNIGTDHPTLPALAGRFLSNYIQFFSPDFLFIHGDANLRHNTGYAGMLLAVMLPLLLLGLWACWKRRAELLPRFTLLCLLLGPVAGALTYPVPHALRGAIMLPFLFVLAAYGMGSIRTITARRPVIPALLTAALVVQGALYTVDMYTSYPVRAGEAFDTGAVPAVLAAAQAANGHTVYISSTLNEQPYIDAFVALLPPPPTSPASDSSGRGLDMLGVRVSDPSAAEQSAQPGDVLVLGPSDPPPRTSAQVIDTERAPVDPLAPQASPRTLVIVYRLA